MADQWNPSNERNGEPKKRSGNEVRVALITLLATGVIALGTQFVTWQMSDDLQEDAARNARLQNDLNEIRRVLDQALRDLNTLQAAAVDKRNVWLEWTRDEANDQQLETAQTDLRQAVAQARADSDQLRIRTGQTGIYNVYWFAYNEYEEVGFCTQTTGDRQPADRLLALGEMYSDSFSDLAFAAAQTELPDPPRGPPDERIAEARQLGDKSAPYLTECHEAQG